MNTEKILERSVAALAISLAVLFSCGAVATVVALFQFIMGVSCE